MHIAHYREEYLDNDNNKSQLTKTLWKQILLTILLLYELETLKKCI